MKTHGLALVGSPQRVLQARLGRPVDVEQVSAVGAALDGASSVLGDRAKEEWDAIVVAFGLSDALQLTPARAWAQALGRLLAKLDGDMPRGLVVPIVVVGVPPMESLCSGGSLSPFVRRHAERLNALTRAEVARNRRTVFAPLPAMADRFARPAGSPAAYRAWADAIAERLEPLLPAELVRVGEQDCSVHAVEPLTAAVLHDDNAAARARLQQLVARVRDAFASDLVLVNLINGDRVWSVVDSSHARPRSVALSTTCCGTTLGEGFFHAPDLAGDPRFASSTLATVHKINSYAGAVVADADGVAVGTLCMFGGGTSGPVDPAALRRAADEVGRELARLHPVAVPTASFAAQPAPWTGTTPLRTAHAPAAPPSTGAVPPDAVAVDEPGRTASRAIGVLSSHITLRTEGRRLTRTGAALVRPTDSDVCVLGPDPLRILVVGGDSAVGPGTRTRSEALDGALARLLHVRTGRGVTVVNRSRDRVRLDQLGASLGPEGARSFDLVVWAPSFGEAARILLRTRWITGIGAMLRRIDATSDAAVVLIGFPSLLGAQPLAVIARARAAQINRLLRWIAARHDRVLVVEPPAITLSEVETVDGPEVYRAVAVQVLPTAVELLEAVASTAAAASGGVPQGLVPA